MTTTHQAGLRPDSDRTPATESVADIRHGLRIRLPRTYVHTHVLTETVVSLEGEDRLTLRAHEQDPR